MRSRPGSFDAGVFFALVVGTALVSGGASALNQVWERDSDARMDRTRNRPFPPAASRRPTPANFGLALCGFGLALLAAAQLAHGGCSGSPPPRATSSPTRRLKRRSSLCTVVGAIPGALPPMMGWAAGRGTLGSPAPGRSSR